MNKLLLGFFTSLFIFISPVWATDADDDTAKDVNHSYPIKEGVQMTSKIKYQYGKNPKMFIKTVYPQLEGDDDIEYDDENISSNEDQTETDANDNQLDLFNQLIMQTVDEQVEQFKNKISSPQNLPKQVNKNDLYIDYNASVVEVKKHHLIGIRFSIQGSLAGMAHPYHYHTVFNYDLDENKKMELSDLFLPNSNYLEILSNYSRQILSRRTTDQNMMLSGTEPKAENFQNWNVKPNGLLITFDEAQVAPYVNGPQNVIIPYSALKKVLSPDSPLACLKTKKRCIHNIVLTGGFIDEAFNSRHGVFNPLLSKR